MAVYWWLLSSFLLFTLYFPSTAMKLNTTILIHPSTSLTKLSSSQLSQTLNFNVSDSLIKPKLLKNRKSSSLTSKIPIFRLAYGAYLIPLSFGTPQQTLHFVFDTGNSLTWFPCGSNYLCHDCSVSHIKQTFDPNKSSSSKVMNCNKSKCSWLQNLSLCSNNCKTNSHTCSHGCPTYEVKYMTGSSTSGVFLLETLNIPKQTQPDFIVGCSTLSSHKIHGIAGFGRGLESLPSQMEIQKFSYCLSSRPFNIDKPQKSYLILNDDSRVKGLRYTPFYRHPSILPHSDYHYVVLEDIVVENEMVKIPQKFLVPGSNGYGGTVMDSGSTFTFLERSIFEAVQREFEKTLGKGTNIGNEGNKGPCFNVSDKKVEDLPKLAFRFNGGATMKLQWWNYLVVRESSMLCLSMVTNDSNDTLRGPTIILGSQQQRDNYIEYDLKRKMLGFKEKICQ